jgi:hypothetical protein
MNGIATNLPMMANAAKIIEIMKIAVVGGDRFISSPSLLVDGRTVIGLSEKASGLHY